MVCRPTIGNELVQVFGDLLADNVWPAIPVERIAEKGQHNLLRQGRQSLKRGLSKVSIRDLRIYVVLSDIYVETVSSVLCSL